MNNYPISCDANVQNTGLSKLCPDISTLTKLIVCPYNYSIATAAEAKLKATWETAINEDKTDRIYPFPVSFNFEDNSEEAVYDEGSTGSIFVRDGKINFTFIIESSRYIHAALKSHSNKQVSVYFGDQAGRVHGVSSDGVFFEAVNMETFTVEKLKVNDGSEGTKTRVTMIFADSATWQTKPAVIAPTDFNVKDLEGLFDVVLTESGTSTTSAVSVRATCNNTDIPVPGLDTTPSGDWIVKDAAGVEEVPTTIDDNDGIYTFNFGTPLTAGDYTFDLKSAKDMTTKGYESTGALTATLV